MSSVESVLVEQQESEQCVRGRQVGVDAEHLLQDLDGSAGVALREIAARAPHQRLNLQVGRIAHRTSGLQSPKRAAICGRKNPSAITTSRPFFPTPPYRLNSS